MNTAEIHPKLTGFQRFRTLLNKRGLLSWILSWSDKREKTRCRDLQSKRQRPLRAS